MANGIQEIIKTAQSPVVIFKPDIPDDLSTLSWDEIKQHSDKAKEDPEKYYQCLGLFAPRLTLDGRTYDVKLVDIGRYDKVSGGKTGFDFLCTDINGTDVGKYAWHNRGAEIFGYKDTSLRNTTLPNLYNLMPSQLKQNIAQVKYMSCYSIGSGQCNHPSAETPWPYGSYDGIFELLQDNLHEVASFDLMLDNDDFFIYTTSLGNSSDISYERYGYNAHVTSSSGVKAEYEGAGLYLPRYPFKVFDPVFIVEKNVEALQPKERRYLVNNSSFYIGSNWNNCYILADIDARGGFESMWTSQKSYSTPWGLVKYRCANVKDFNISSQRSAKTIQWDWHPYDSYGGVTNNGYSDNKDVFIQGAATEIINAPRNVEGFEEQFLGHLCFVFSLS